jgi:integrase/recombinase XerD
LRNLLRQRKERNAVSVAESSPPPVEFAVAVERYLASAELSEASRRVYGIALTAWTWTLVGGAAPTGRARRGARPPVVPLAALADPLLAARIRAALDSRSPRTRERELSTLRSAVRWWRGQGWLRDDPLRALGQVAPSPEPEPEPSEPEPAEPEPGPEPASERAWTQSSSLTRPLTPDQLRAVLGLRAGLREQTLWHLLHDSGASAAEALALDLADLDRARRRTHVRTHGRGLPRLEWSDTTARLLGLLLQGRTSGPVFLTDRRARAGTPTADRCPLTGRGRLSYRRAAELFSEATRPLDPLGRGWTLHRLRVLPQATPGENA